MEQERVPSRPRQVTFAGIAAASTCAVLVLVLFEQMAAVRSIETRQAVADALARPPFAGMGIAPGQALDLLHALVLLSGALAAAGCVLGVFSLQRHRGARLGLSVVAVLLVLTSLSVAGLLPVIVVVAAAALWTPQARAWFDGRTYERPAAPAINTSSGSAYPGPPPHAHASPQATDSTPVDPTWAPPAAARPPVEAVGAVEVAESAERGRRPGVVTAALAITWVCCGLVSAGLVLVMVRALLDKQGLFEQVRSSAQSSRLASTPNAVLSELLVTCVVLLLWSLAVAAVALPADLRAGWARIALVVNAAVVALFSLILTVAVPVVGVLLLAASGGVVVLLLLPAAGAWYAGRPRSPRPSRPRPEGRPPVW